MGWFSDLFGGGDSRTEGINYPEWYTDPHFSGSQDFLDQYSRDLLNRGPNDYYRPIGEYGTPEFLNFINQTNAETLKGVNEQLAKSGRARGGRGGEIASQALGDANAKLLYADYVRAMQGRQHFFDTGLNVQANVRDAGFKNQESRNKFNVGGAEFNLQKAIYGDGYDRQQSSDIGKMIGNIAPLAGAGIGFMLGGPAGASAGYGFGSSLFGGEGTTPQWLDTITNSRKGTTTESPSGVSSLGRITDGMDSATLMKLLAQIHG